MHPLLVKIGKAGSSGVKFGISNNRQYIRYNCCDFLIDSGLLCFCICWSWGRSSQQSVSGSAALWN